VREGESGLDALSWAHDAFKRDLRRGRLWQLLLTS